MLNTLSENVYVVPCTSTFWRNSLTSLSVSLQPFVLLFEKCQQFCEVLQNGGAVCALSLLLAPETILQLLDCNWDSAIRIFLSQASINIAAFYQVKNSGYPLSSRWFWGCSSIFVTYLSYAEIFIISLGLLLRVSRFFFGFQISFFFFLPVVPTLFM